MHLYSGPSPQFVEDATLNAIGEKIAASFFEQYRYRAPQSEVAAWQNSLRAMGNVVQHAGLDDQGVVVEWQLPLSSRRLDVMLTGHDPQGQPHGVIVELKQWSSTEPTHVEECVVTFVGGRKREVLHPSAQVLGYRQYLADTHSAFTSQEIALSACSFLHNMTHDGVAALFVGNEVDEIGVEALPGERVVGGPPPPRSVVDVAPVDPSIECGRLLVSFEVRCRVGPRCGSYYRHERMIALVTVGEEVVAREPGRRFRVHLPQEEGTDRVAPPETVQDCPDLVGEPHELALADGSR